MSDFDGEEVSENPDKFKPKELRDWDEIKINVPWGQISGKWYGNRDVQPILALHGWMDNAGSFDRLIPLLPQKIPVFSIDLPGHGFSSHFPAGVSYHLFWDYIPVIRRIVKHFGWHKVKLIGHSMGGGISFMYAASFPKDVEQIILLDTYGPVVRNPRTDAVITGSCIDKVLSFESLSATNQPQYTYEDVIKRMLDEGLADRESARILLKRSLVPVEDSNGDEKFTISTDPRLKFCGLGLFTLEHVQTYAALIQCPVLNIRAMPGIKLDRPEIYQKVLSVLSNNIEVDYHEVPGSHYLHLQSPEKIADILSMFLLNINHI